MGAQIVPVTNHFYVQTRSGRSVTSVSVRARHACSEYCNSHTLLLLTEVDQDSALVGRFLASRIYAVLRDAKCDSDHDGLFSIM